VLPALLARFCGGAGVGSGAWVRPDLEVQASTHTITAAEPLPDDLRQALEATRRTAAERPQPLRNVPSPHHGDGPDNEPGLTLHGPLLV
jgi:hypothetical protein